MILSLTRRQHQCSNFVNVYNLRTATLGRNMQFKKKLMFKEKLVRMKRTVCKSDCQISTKIEHDAPRCYVIDVCWQSCPHSCASNSHLRNGIAIVSPCPSNYALFAWNVRSKREIEDSCHVCLSNGLLRSCRPVVTNLGFTSCVPEPPCCVGSAVLFFLTQVQVLSVLVFFSVSRWIKVTAKELYYLLSIF